MIFPKELDNACVLYYTPLSDYGTVFYTTGEIADHICYWAIAKYENDSSFYLFGCNVKCEVVSDSQWESAEECMHVAQDSYGGIISWIAMV